MPRPKKTKEEKRLAQRGRKKRYQYRQAKIFSPRQDTFLRVFFATRDKAKAAIAAGYGGPPEQAGYQAFKYILKKAPEIIHEMGISGENLIENHLLPLLGATESKYFQDGGNVTEIHIVADNNIRLNAVRTMCELMNLFPPKDPVLAAQVGIRVVCEDIPAASDEEMKIINVAPRSTHTPKLAADNNGAKKARGNGARPTVDPRPKD